MGHSSAKRVAEQNGDFNAGESVFSPKKALFEHKLKINFKIIIKIKKK